MAVPPDRLLAAAAVVAAYAGFCAPFAWAAVRRAWAVRKAEAPAETGADPILVAYASQTGSAEALARRTAEVLSAAEQPVRVMPLGHVSAPVLATAGRALFLVSTTGEGDPPEDALPFLKGALAAEPDLGGLSYAVLALGDRSYSRYCGFGRRLDDWLAGRGGRCLFERIEVDRGDPSALGLWRERLAETLGAESASGWSAPFARWRLVERRVLNPGGPGAPAFHLAFEPLDGPASWTAGDIAEVRPDNDPARPHRDYSISSIPADGRLELLVRQAAREDGSLGLGSGWLTERLDLGGETIIRIRTNSAFHPPEDGRPLLLVGAGTGMAGLRAHLKARALTGGAPCWLVFGERVRANGRFYGSEIDAWLATGVLARADFAFSREEPDRPYVGHRLEDLADEVRRFVEAGASVYVCGSRVGMGEGVNRALAEILGPDGLETLASQGRCRRDVY